MGLFKKMMGKSEPEAGPSSGSAPPARPSQESEKKDSRMQSQDHSTQGYQAPPGPPPNYGAGRQGAVNDTYLPPPGPPPGYTGSASDRLQHDDYEAPPGPPPSHHAQSRQQEDQYQPPPGPPPGLDDEPPSYHDWQSAVPDTSLLPPPPAANNIFSSSSNATENDAARAWQWCEKNPLRAAGNPSSQQIEASEAGAVKLMSPGFKTHSTLTELDEGSWTGKTTDRSTDLCFTTNLPLYYALGAASPKKTGQLFAAYFEVHVNRIGRADSQGNLPSLAIGFVAAPYPVWRLPGWQRGSLAVHSDDGCRYVNNQDGGLDFVEPFRAGDVVGLGIRYWIGSWGQGAENSLQGEAFFTRNGQIEGTWSMQEETDAANQLGNMGVTGDHDLFGAIGTFGEVGFKAVFKPQAWAFKPKPGQIPGLRA